MDTVIDVWYDCDMKSMIKNLIFKKKSDIVQELDEYIQELHQNEIREKRFVKKETFSPSTIGYGHGSCPRYWKFAFDGAEFDETTDVFGIAAMGKGTESHTRLQGMFANGPLPTEIEKEIFIEDPPVHGFVDIILDDLPIEIKTARLESFMARQSTMKALDYNLVQFLIYLVALDKEEGIIMYENKNDQTYLLIPVKMDEKNRAIADYVLGWLRDVRAAWESGTLAERPFTRKSKECKGCPVRETCWNASDGDLKIKPLEIIS